MVGRVRAKVVPLLVECRVWSTNRRARTGMSMRLFSAPFRAIAWSAKTQVALESRK